MSETLVQKTTRDVILKVEVKEDRSFGIYAKGEMDNKGGLHWAEVACPLNLSFGPFCKDLAQLQTKLIEYFETNYLEKGYHISIDIKRE